MTYEKMSTLVQRLYKKTKKGEIDWEEITEPGIFMAALPGYAVFISRRSSSGSDSTFDQVGNDYVISINNLDGRVIEEVTDVDLRLVWEHSYRDMGNLYEAARRKAMGVEEALDDILSELLSDELDD